MIRAAFAVAVADFFSSCVSFLLFLLMAFSALAGKVEVVQDQPTALYRVGEEARFTVSVRDDAGALLKAAYFDGVNFAARIRHPIRFLVGFADTTCPPADVYAAYNVCPSADKAIINAIGSGHSWLAWYEAHRGRPECPDVDAWLRERTR